MAKPLPKIYLGIDIGKQFKDFSAFLQWIKPFKATIYYLTLIEFQ